VEAEKPTKESIISKDRSIYFDDFARKQASPSRTNEEHRVVVPETFKLNKIKDSFSEFSDGAEMEWDRLIKERENLLQSGNYSKDDLLIREFDRQI